MQRLASAIILLFLGGFIFLMGMLASEQGWLDEPMRILLAKMQVQTDIREPLDAHIHVETREEGHAFPGALLIGSHYLVDPAIVLVNAAGEILHRWNVEKSTANQAVLDLHPPLHKALEDQFYGIDDAMLMPDGSVIFSQSLRELNNLRAQRIARIDKNSKLMWEIPGLFHHDMILAEDGLIYATGSEARDTLPVVATQSDPKALYLGGVVHILTPEGEYRQTLHIEEAFANSPYAHWLNTFRVDLGDIQAVALRDEVKLYDPIHLNSVDYITAEQAALHDGLAEGDLLLSMRGPSMIAILRPSENRILWAARGPWRHQHYVRMQADGSILIYDNEGDSRFDLRDSQSIRLDIQPRVIRYDMASGQSSVAIRTPEDVDMASYWRGYYKELANGDWLMSSSNRGRVLQLDPSGNIVWQLALGPLAQKGEVLYNQKLVSVRYVDAPDIPAAFLSADRP